MYNSLTKDNTESFQLGYNDLHIWKVNNSNSEIIKECICILSEEEIVKADYFKFNEARIQYIISQGMLKILLSKYYHHAAQIHVISHLNTNKLPYDILLPHPNR